MLATGKRMLITGGSAMAPLTGKMTLMGRKTLRERVEYAGGEEDAADRRRAPIGRSTTPMMEGGANG